MWAILFLTQWDHKGWLWLKLWATSIYNKHGPSSIQTLISYKDQDNISLDI